MTAIKICFAASALLLVSQPVIAQPTTFECTPSKFRILALGIGRITTVAAPQYAELFGNGTGTTITPATGGCVVVEISAVVDASGTVVVAPEVRVLVDDKPSTFPSQVIWPTDGVSSASFVFPKVPAGTHRVRVQFRVPAGFASGTQAFFKHYNVLIKHAP